MKPASFAPAYVAIYPRLAEVARQHGYSLAIHGSVGQSAYSDLDLVAIPWTEEAVEAELLMVAIWEWCEKFLDVRFGDLFKKEYYPEQKPHGRRAWFLQMGNGSGIDISVMPRVAA